MRTIGIIPARYQSTRFPGKPLINILGKSMIQRVYEQSKKSDLDQVIVATDDERIFDTVQSFKGQVMMTSTQHISGTDRCMEVLDNLNSKYEVVVNIQGDEPFVDPEQINTLIHAFRESQTQIATLAKLIENAEDLKNPNKPKVSFDENYMATSFDRVVDTNFFPNNFYKHIGLYAYRPEVLKNICTLEPSVIELSQKLEQWRWLENGYNIKVERSTKDAFSVDTPDDLKKIIERFGDTY
jgi:3-deoxy-manno-octulosonate cytidylyltransferase (CMP-KDO synthetase)